MGSGLVSKIQVEDVGVLVFECIWSLEDVRTFLISQALKPGTRRCQSRGCKDPALLLCLDTLSSWGWSCAIWSDQAVPQVWWTCLFQWPYSIAWWSGLMGEKTSQNRCWYWMSLNQFQGDRYPQGEQREDVIIVKVPEQRVPRSDGMWLYLARNLWILWPLKASQLDFKMLLTRDYAASSDLGM